MRSRTALRFSGAAALLAVLVASATLLAQEASFDGRCIGVVDGDTIEVLDGTTPRRIRLDGIDAPERSQPFSEKSRQHLAYLVFGKAVRVEAHGTDRWDRLIARVTAGGRDLSEAMIAAGYAWHFKRYSADSTLAALELDARRAARGLWVADRPIPPWLFREAEGRLGAGEIDEASGPYHGNVRSGVFHRPSCQHYDCKNCVSVLPDRQAAIAAGFRPCGICRP